MFQINIRGQRQDDGNVPSWWVWVPALPRAGDVISMTNDDGDSLNGTVREVLFYWPADDELEIQVQLK
jgi:hypothetical protein